MQKRMTVGIGMGAGLLALLFWCGCTAPKSSEWQLVFSDEGSQDWKEHWFLEGAKASVENSEEGMIFTAGPVPREQASHAVLWSKQSFEGDIRIEYDYTRMDQLLDTISVNILYIQATGLGTEASPVDIFESTADRSVPWMKYYFMNMHALHISYATTDPKRGSYVAVRRYPAPELKAFSETEVLPIYDNVTLFKPGETYHITATKVGDRLTFTAERDDQQETFEWDTSAFAPVTEGRIGFRHMWARSSRYKNIKIYLKK